MEEEIKNKDSLITLKKLIILQKDKQLVDKDSVETIKNKQVNQLTIENTNLKKEVVSLKTYKNILIGIIPIVIIETLIIILK